MELITAVLLVCQALGAVVGAGTAVWGELAYIRAHRDGKIDRHERAHLAVIERGLRFGLSLVLLSSLGLVVAAYVGEAVIQPAYTMSYWLLIGLAFVVLSVSWAMSRKVLSFAYGSAIAFAAWWCLVFLTVGGLPVASPLEAVLTFALAVLAFGGILFLMRRFALRSR